MKLFLLQFYISILKYQSMPIISIEFYQTVNDCSLQVLEYKWYFLCQIDSLVQFSFDGFENIFTRQPIVVLFFCSVQIEINEEKIIFHTRRREEYSICIYILQKCQRTRNTGSDPRTYRIEQNVSVYIVCRFESRPQRRTCVGIFK